MHRTKGAEAEEEAKTATVKTGGAVNGSQSSVDQRNTSQLGYHVSF